jgi:uncharacterized protein YktB (UPF0637 family)
MKLEIEISDEEFNKILRNKAVALLSEYVNNWGTQATIRKELTDKFKPALDKIIEEEIANIEDIKATLHTEMKRQINVKLQKLLKTL